MNSKIRKIIRKNDKSVSGVFLFDKPPMITSHGAVKLLREKLFIQRIGHSGTLDPMATGLLILLVGSATKFQSSFQNSRKIYEGEITFGMETDTWDKEGRELSGTDPEISKASIRKVVEFMSGKILQRVPPFSAVKYKGKKLYKLARRRMAVPVIKREVSVKWLSYSYANPVLKFKIECSGGTYIRSIAHEMGKILAVGGHLSFLRRIKIGTWDIKNAFDFDFLNSASKREIEEKLIKISDESA